MIITGSWGALELVMALKIDIITSKNPSTVFPSEKWISLHRTTARGLARSARASHRFREHARLCTRKHINPGLRREDRLYLGYASV